MTKLIRNAVRALIISNNQILLIKNRNADNEIYYMLPGGGQRNSEDLSEALKRECLEELGLKISIKDIVFVIEYISSRHEYSMHDEYFHQVDIIFDCYLENPKQLNKYLSEDLTQVGYEWINIEDIFQVNIIPLGISEKIVDSIESKNSRIYLGEMG